VIENYYLLRERNGGWFGVKAWWREWFDAYVGADYTGLIVEYMERWGIE
jgi:dimethylaniline monooxygenase (N-oxide forming)